MCIFEKLLEEIKIPRFVKVHHAMNNMHIENIQDAVIKALQRNNTLDSIKMGDSVCVAVGSREISNISLITRCICDVIKSMGASPFIIPAMGSHGGATAEGQKKILAGYNITEETMGVPITSSMETEKIGETVSGVDVRLDKYANNANYIVPIGRIKPHTDFYGKVESGLCKMMVIGMGKQYGAYMCHKQGFKNMGKNIIEFANVIIAKKPNMFALGIIENAYHQTYKIVAVPANRVMDEEPDLLLEAKCITAMIPFEKADVLFVDQIGKDISGAGMDSKVTGRSAINGIDKPFFQSIAVFNLTEKSHGNFTGLGNADVTTSKVLKKIDFESTYTNAITSVSSSAVKIPTVMPNDKSAMKYALLMASEGESSSKKVIWIRDTLSLNNMYISEALIDDAKNIPSVTILDRYPCEVKFDQDGNIAGWMNDQTISI